MEVFPKVQVLDNWGWCSGECDNGDYPAGYKNIGCYEDDLNRCSLVEDDPNLNPWKEYNGNVRVK
jgi:hypothetical protein